MISLGPWEPDSFVLNDSKVATALNVLPVANGWGPAPDVTVISSALGAKCVGAVSVRTSANTYQIYAGTATGLYRYNSGTLGWDDLSGATTFSVPDGDYWSFDLFGSYLLATNISDGLFEIDTGSGTEFAATTGSPPKARFVSVVGDFVVLGCLENGQNKLHWSGLNDREEWTTGTNFSDTQEFPDGGVVRGLAGQEAGLVFQEDTIRRMTLAGGSAIFNFSVLARQKRLRASYSLVTVGATCFAVMDHGICAYTQAGETPIGVGKVDRWLKATADAAWFLRIQGCVDPTETRIYWAFRSVDGSASSYSDKILVYDTTLGRFSLINSNTDYIFPAASAGFTLEALDDFGTLDTLTSSLDSAVWGGGTPAFGQISSGHILGFRTGSHMAGEIIATDRSLSGGKRSLVTSLYPYTDCATVTASIAGKQTPADAASYSAAASQTSTGRIPLRKDGRFHSVKLGFPAAADWTYANGIDLGYVETGDR